MNTAEGLVRGQGVRTPAPSEVSSSQAIVSCQSEISVPTSSIPNGGEGVKTGAVRMAAPQSPSRAPLLAWMCSPPTTPRPPPSLRLSRRRRDTEERYPKPVSLTGSPVQAFFPVSVPSWLREIPFLFCLISRFEGWDHKPKISVLRELLLLPDALQRKSPNSTRDWRSEVRWMRGDATSAPVSSAQSRRHVVHDKAP